VAALVAAASGVGLVAATKRLPPRQVALPFRCRDGLSLFAARLSSARPGQDPMFASGGGV